MVICCGTTISATILPSWVLKNRRSVSTPRPPKVSTLQRHASGAVTSSAAARSDDTETATTSGTPTPGLSTVRRAVTERLSSTLLESVAQAFAAGGLPFAETWQLLALVLMALLGICTFSALISIIKLARLEPASEKIGPQALVSVLGQADGNGGSARHGVA